MSGTDDATHSFALIGPANSRSRSSGAVVMSDSSRTPDRASCNVRGIGVAVSVSTCTSERSAFSFSL